MYGRWLLDSGRWRLLEICPQPAARNLARSLSLEATLVSFLDGLGSKVFWFAAICLIVLDGAALAVFVATRSRRLVDEWTPKLVAANVTLLGAGLGVPVAAALAKFGVRAIAAMFGGGAAPIE
jgi:hypothetical protein